MQKCLQAHCICKSDSLLRSVKELRDCEHILPHFYSQEQPTHPRDAKIAPTTDFIIATFSISTVSFANDFAAISSPELTWNSSWRVQTALNSLIAATFAPNCSSECAETNPANGQYSTSLVGLGCADAIVCDISLRVWFSGIPWSTEVLYNSYI